MATFDQQSADMLCALERLGINIPTHEPIDDITDGLDSLGLTKLAANQTDSTLGPNAFYHELHLEYPAMKLLTDDASAYLWPPRNVCYRESPRMGSFHHDVDNLAFCTRFDTWTNVASCDIPDDYESHNIFEAIARLSESPGISNLEVVAFIANDTIHYRARLSTTWLANDICGTESHTYNYTGIEWSVRFALAMENGSEDIISSLTLLEHLMDRASDRAYLHVRERLRAHSPTLARAHDQQWSTKWDTAARQSPNEILVNNITWHKDVGAHLPCDCMVLGLSPFYLMNVTTEDEAANFLCPLCSTPVLNNEETQTAFFQLNHRQDRRARLKAKIDEQCWNILPSQLDDASCPRTLEVANVDLLSALQETLNTFELPESVLPADTCPTVFTETATVTLCLGTLLSANESATIKIDPNTMPGFLLDIAEKALRAEAGLVAGSEIELRRVLPVGYREFLLRWFSRAVTLVAYQVKRREDQVADQLMAFMMGRKVHGDPGASWKAHRTSKM